MKLCVYSFPEVSPGKRSIKDARLDEVNTLTGSKKKTYVQIECVGPDAVADADVIVSAESARADLILGDLEFVETRLSRAEDSAERQFLEKLKQALEKETLLSGESVSLEEEKLLSGYGLLTVKPVIFISAWDEEQAPVFLQRVLKEGGYCCFFTTGEKETRAWLIRQGTTAWEAAGVIHSDIQRGFIRAEVIGIEDFIQCKGETAAKQAQKMRLEAKEYVVQDADVMMFRFNR